MRSLGLIDSRRISSVPKQQARRPRGRPPTAMRFQEEQQQRAADSLGGASRPRSGGGAVFARMSKQSDVAADVSGKPSGMRVNGSASDLRAPGMNGVGPAFSGATPSRGDTPTPATSSGVPVPGTIVGRSRPRKPNRNEVVSGDPTLKHEQRESSLGPTNKMPARQHGRPAPPATPRAPLTPPFTPRQPHSKVVPPRARAARLTPRAAPPAAPHHARCDGAPAAPPICRAAATAEGGLQHSIVARRHVATASRCVARRCLRYPRLRLPWRLCPLPPGAAAESAIPPLPLPLCASAAPPRPPSRFAQKIIGGRCSACVKTKKGSCGTATAPRSCLRLIEGQRAASILPTLPSLQPSIFGADQQKSDPYRALDDFILRWEAPPQPERKPEDDEEYAEGDGDGDGDEPEPEDQQHEDGGAPGEGRRKPSPPTPSGGSAEEAD